MALIERKLARFFYIAEMYGEGLFKDRVVTVFRQLFFSLPGGEPGQRNISRANTGLNSAAGIGLCETYAEKHQKYGYNDKN